MRTGGKAGKARSKAAAPLAAAGQLSTQGPLLVASHGTSALDAVTGADWMRTRLPEASLLQQIALPQHPAPVQAPQGMAEDDDVSALAEPAPPELAAQEDDMGIEEAAVRAPHDAAEEDAPDMEEAVAAIGALEDVMATEQQQAHGSAEALAGPAKQEHLQAARITGVEDDDESKSADALEAALQSSAAADEGAGETVVEVDPHIPVVGVAEPEIADAELGMQGSAAEVGGTSPAPQTAATMPAPPAEAAAQDMEEEQGGEPLATDGMGTLGADAWEAEASSTDPVNPAQQLKRAASKEDQHEMAALQAEVCAITCPQVHHLPNFEAGHIFNLSVLHTWHGSILLTWHAARAAAQMAAKQEALAQLRAAVESAEVAGDAHSSAITGMQVPARSALPATALVHCFVLLVDSAEL
jgi:hypothetical protein